MWKKREIQHRDESKETNVRRSNFKGYQNPTWTSLHLLAFGQQWFNIKAPVSIKGATSTLPCAHVCSIPRLCWHELSLLQPSYLNDRSPVDNGVIQYGVQTNGYESIVLRYLGREVPTPSHSNHILSHTIYWSAELYMCMPKWWPVDLSGSVQSVHEEGGGVYRWGEWSIYRQVR